MKKSEKAELELLREKEERTKAKRRRQNERFLDGKRRFVVILPENLGADIVKSAQQNAQSITEWFKFAAEARVMSARGTKETDC